MASNKAPSLLRADMAPAVGSAEPISQVDSSLLDLLYDGFVMLFLLRKKQHPPTAAQFSTDIRNYLNEFDRNTRKISVSAEQAHIAKYAFCAVVDEFILSAPDFSARSEWERRPLQLVLFGDQLAGENFFNMLEMERAQGAARIQTLEVFYMCLLLGFQGKYALDGTEKLAYLTARVGDEVANARGKQTPFSPHWGLPDLISHSLKREAPQWVVAVMFALMGLLGFIGLSAHLRNDTQALLSEYQSVVKLGPRQANLNISLP